MKRIATVLAIAAMSISCKVQKTGPDTYKVIAPTPEAKAAAEKAKQQAKEAAEKLKEKTAEAAQKTGTALEKAGREMKEKTETTKTGTH